MMVTLVETHEKGSSLPPTDIWSLATADSDWFQPMLPHLGLLRPSVALLPEMSFTAPDEVQPQPRAMDNGQDLPRGIGWTC